MTGVRRTAAALGLLVLVGGCSTGTSVSRGTPTASPSSSFTASVSLEPAVTSSPSSRPVASPTSAPGSKDFGYFTAVEEGSPTKLEFDRALFLTGAAAVKASEAHGQGSTVSNDYYIVNDNKLLRVLSVSPTCAVYGSLQLNSFVGNGEVDARRQKLSDLLRFLRTAGGRSTPWHVTYGAGGVVTRIEEQYVP